MLSVDDTCIALVEELEAFEGLEISTGLFESFEPVIGNDMLYKRKIDHVALMEFGVRSLELVFNVTGCHFMETKVLENISEQTIRNHTCLILIIMVEAFL